jgi:hypothetical protein
MSKEINPPEDISAGAFDFLQECPLCREKYSDQCRTVIEQGEDSELMHITCGECFISVLAIITTTQFGMMSVGVMTDLSVGDISKFLTRSPLSADDVISFHQHLQGKGVFEKEMSKYLNK